MCTRVCVCFALLVSVPAQRSRPCSPASSLPSCRKNKKLLVQISYKDELVLRHQDDAVSDGCHSVGGCTARKRVIEHPPQLNAKARPQGAELPLAMAALSIRGRGVGCTGVAGATFSPVASSVRCLATPGPERAVLTGTLFFCFHITTSVLHLVRLYRFAGALLYWA